ncbi:MAG: 23S rRNA (pseudouridine(1915)-N(3))-methyltransferase RlmH [Flavobacteriales bacterium]|jgi:23S rRNA (pseudouridine1915-N3)-methyltransferase|tara:strand:+ start:16403 stop:16879 length:477 start_codon:yes stop_codon:yes gene_type:complete
MNIKLIVVGKTVKSYFTEAEEEYLKRLKHYIKVNYIVIPELKKTKNLSVDEIKNKEGELIQKHLNPTDIVWLMDEKGKHKTSLEFADFLQQKMNQGTKDLVFIIGGAFGFSDEIYQEYNSKLSLSKMTFSHQMIRTFLLEQIYRGMSIIKNQPYHNEG